MTQQLDDLTRGQITELSDGIMAAIADGLKAASDGKLTVSIPIELTLTPGRLYCEASVSYARKFKDSTENSVAIEDPNQPELKT